MKSIGQALPAEALDQVVQEVAPADLNSAELQQFKDYLSRMDTKQVRAFSEELKSAARVRGRKIMLREQLLSRIGTEWLRKQQEMTEARLAEVEVGKDIHDFNLLELDIAGQTWRLGKMAKVQRLDEMAQTDPLINMIKRQETDQEQEVLGSEAAMDDAKLESLFEIK